MIETALVFDVQGRVIAWHLPEGRTGASIPDSRGLWEILWAERARLGGVAHTHPGPGRASPSETDVTTFAACEAALGKRLRWVIATDDDVATYQWVGPQRLGYQRIEADEIESVAELRRLSRGE